MQKKIDIICQLDMEKASDSVHQEFLISMLRLIGFVEKWITCISLCISTVKLSIIINGASKGFLMAKEG